MFEEMIKKRSWIGRKLLRRKINIFLSTIFLNFLIVNVSILLISNSAEADGSPSSFSYQARVYDSTGTVPITEEVNIVFSIYSPEGNCLLYEEEQYNIDLSDSNGLVSLQVGSVLGSGKRSTSDPRLSMINVYSNMGKSILYQEPPIV